MLYCCKIHVESEKVVSWKIFLEAGYRTKNLKITKVCWSVICTSIIDFVHFWIQHNILYIQKKLSEDCIIRTMSPWSHHSFIRCKTKKGLSLTLFNMGGLCKVHYMVETATKERYDHLFISWPLLPAFGRIDVRLADCLPACNELQSNA